MQRRRPPFRERERRAVRSIVPSVVARSFRMGSHSDRHCFERRREREREKREKNVSFRPTEIIFRGDADTCPRGREATDDSTAPILRSFGALRSLPPARPPKKHFREVPSPSPGWAHRPAPMRGNESRLPHPLPQVVRCFGHPAFFSLFHDAPELDHFPPLTPPTTTRGRKSSRNPGPDRACNERLATTGRTIKRRLLFLRTTVDIALLS